MPVMRRLAALAIATALLAACGDAGAEVGSGPATDGGGRGGSDPLDGRTFVTTEITEDGAPHPLVEGTELRLSFADGTIAIEAGCNHLRAEYTIDGDTLTATGGVTTDMGCDPGRHEQDEWISRVLTGPIDWALDDTTLVLTSGGTVLRLSDREVASPDVPLLGTEWQLDTLIDGELASSSPGMAGTLAIADDGTYAVATGCNTGSGTVEVSESTLTFTPPGLTRLACEDDAAAVEAAMTAVLDGEVAYEVDERRLTLTAGERGLGFTAP